MGYLVVENLDARFQAHKRAGEQKRRREGEFRQGYLVVGDLIELPEAGLGLRVAQQVLGRHHNKRLSELAVNLAPQQVEVVGRCCDIGHLRAHTQTQLQVACTENAVMGHQSTQKMINASKATAAVRACMRTESAGGVLEGTSHNRGDLSCTANI
jgi:hypothetical protein